jgi:CubicO group peptidase (beta-lactamase class C family)
MMHRQNRFMSGIWVLYVFLAPSPVTLPQTGRRDPASQSIQREVDKLFAPWDKRDSPGCALAVLEKWKAVLYARVWHGRPGAFHPNFSGNSVPDRVKLQAVHGHGCDFACRRRKAFAR